MNFSGISVSNQLEANRWYIWWEKKWILRIPHYVFLFNVRREKHELIMITKKNARYIKCDPFHLNLKGVLIQKREDAPEKWIPSRF